MNKTTLERLFKPFKLEFQTIATVRNKSTRLRKIFDEDRIIERLKTRQCSKSKNRLCGNSRCPHNLLKYNYFE